MLAFPHVAHSRRERRHLHRRGAGLAACTADVCDAAGSERLVEVYINIGARIRVGELQRRVGTEHLAGVAHQCFVVRHCHQCHVLVPVAWCLYHRHLKGDVLAALYDHLRRGEPLHALVGRYPFAACHVAVGGITLEVEPDALGFLRREYELIPPLRRKDLEGTLAVTVHLIVIDYASYALLLKGFQVGCDTLMGTDSLTMKPPHFCAGRVLRVFETV